MNPKKEKSRFTSVSLPINLVEKIKAQIKGTGFTSVGSYVEYVLREILVEKATKKEKNQLDNQGEERVKERLRALGYLD